MGLSDWRRLGDSLFDLSSICLSLMDNPGWKVILSNSVVPGEYWFFVYDWMHNLNRFDLTSTNTSN